MTCGHNGHALLELSCKHVVRFHLARHNSRTTNSAAVKYGLQSQLDRVIGDVTF